LRYSSTQQPRHQNKDEMMKHTIIWMAHEKLYITLVHAHVREETNECGTTCLYSKWFKFINHKIYVTTAPLLDFTCILVVDLNVFNIIYMYVVHLLCQRDQRQLIVA
jgi:hypothetical protein